MVFFTSCNCFLKGIKEIQIPKIPKPPMLARTVSGFDEEDKENGEKRELSTQASIEIAIEAGRVAAQVIRQRRLVRELGENLG